jgi:hypothetical protein
MVRFDNELPAESFADPLRDIGEASIEAERTQWRVHDAANEIRVPKPGHGGSPDR